MIGVIASMQQELQFVDKCEFVEKEECGIFTFNRYKYKNIDIVTGICGTGKVSAATCAQMMIYKYSPHAVISMGTSGSLKDGMKINDIVISTAAIQYDFDCSPFGYRKGELVELKVVEMKADEKLLAAAKKACTEKNVHFGNVLSADRVVVNDSEKKIITSEFEGICCEMEAGAIAQTCLQNKVGFIAVKGISDGEEEEEQRFDEFKTNILSSSVSCGDAFLKMLDGLKGEEI